MRNINEIATWFKINNKLSYDENRVKLLSLYAKIAFTITGNYVRCTELSFEGNTFNIGITSTNEELDFTNEELQILKTINKIFGYEKLSTLFANISYVQNYTIENITAYLKNDLTSILEQYSKYSFNENILFINDKIFFVDKKVILTEEEQKLLDNCKNSNQPTFSVYRDISTRKLVIY